MSNNAGAFSGGAGLIDDVLGSAYLIVKHIYDNLDPILEVANRTTKIDLIKENLDLIEGSVLSSRMATILEVIGNYRSTLAEAADIPVGSYFSSGDSGEFKIYLKESEDTYTDVGNLIEPLSSDFMDELSSLYADMQANLASSLTTKSEVENLKGDVMGLLSQVEDLKDLTETLKNEAVNYGNAQVYESWAALNSIGVDDGTHYAFVMSSDEGTHLDPVTAEEVPNSGFFKESLSPIGWQRVSDSESSKAAFFAASSQEWAEGTEPGGPGTKSAKGWTDRAAVLAYLASNPFADTTALNAYSNAALADGMTTTIKGDGEYDRTGGAWVRRTDDAVKRAADSANAANTSKVATDAALAALLSSGTAYLWPAVVDGDVVYLDASNRLGAEPISASDATIGALEARLKTVEGTVNTAVSPIGDVLGGGTFGQSLSVGNASGAVKTTTAVPGGLRFSVGVRPQDSGSETPANWGTLASLVETTVTGLCETPCAGILQRINERLTADFGVNITGLSQEMFMAAPGQSGQSLQALSPGAGTGYYERFANSHAQAATLCAAAGKTYNPLFVHWMQGEAQTGNTAIQYYVPLLALWAAMQASADTARGYSRPFIFSAYQHASWAGGTGSWVAPLGAEPFLWIQERNAYGLFAGPIYWSEYSSYPGLHLTSKGYKMVGAQAGDVLYDFLFKGYKRPVLRPTLERISARRYLARYSLRPGARLVRDTSLTSAMGVTLATLGLAICAKTDLTQVPTTNILTSAKITGRDTIMLETSADVPQGETYQLRQGWYGSQRNVTEIRDTAGDVLPVFDPTDINVRIHNWAPICAVDIP